MRIFPTNENKKCGLLNYLFERNTSTKSVYIPENAYNNDFFGRIQSIINCHLLSEWPSSIDDPTLSIQLYNVMIKPSHVSFTRRNNANYPSEAILQGLEYSGWKDICHFPTIKIEKYSTTVLQCNTENFFNSFRLKQISSSASHLQYLELDSFDIFGTLNGFITCSTRKHYFHYYFLCLFILSKTK